MKKNKTIIAIDSPLIKKIDKILPSTNCIYDGVAMMAGALLGLLGFALLNVHGSFVFICTLLGLFTPFTITSLTTIDPLICKSLVDLASPDELPALMEVIHAGKGRPRAYKLGQLNTELKKIALAAKENAALDAIGVFSEKQHVKI